MNFKTLDIQNIERLIAHEIVSKTHASPAKARIKDKLLTFTQDEKATLINRVLSALRNAKKTFQLRFEDTGDGSVYSYLNTELNSDDQRFIAFSRELAHKLADAQKRINIPGGYCLVGDGKTKNGIPFYFVIKAELQQVFNIEKDALHLIKDVFLSPAKDFYKIGFFLNIENEITPFMYDDQFSMQKKDLTEYFYAQFLGLTTDQNDRLRTKNFYDETKSFIEDNIDNFSDRIQLHKALDVLYREDATGVIAPELFSETYLEGELKEKFDAIISRDFPNAFTKDISLMENKLDFTRVSIPLSYSLKIIGSTASLDHINVLENPDADSVRKLLPEINNGNVRSLIVLKEVNTSNEPNPMTNGHELPPIHFSVEDGNSPKSLTDGTNMQE